MGKAPSAIAIVLAVGTISSLGLIFRPELLFIDKEVDGAGPVAAQVSPTPVMEGAVTTPTESPTAVPAQVGTFVSGEHETSGTAEYVLTNEGAVVRLADFSTSNGPDVRVYLLPGNGTDDEAAIKAGTYVDLGALKGNVGNQNYAVPAGTDLAKYGRVSVWCRRFSVAFGQADIR